MENTCKKCLCSTCKNYNCPVPCKAHIPCDFPVTKCKDYIKK